MAKSLAKAAGRKVPESFRLGLKQVFLPTHVITFLRRDNLPPNWAHFQVPLTFNKLDLRDYLWNLYGIEAKRVRSAVLLSKPELKRVYRGPSYRPASTKFMTVEMAKPFVWPDMPQDKTPWNHELWLAREKRSTRTREEQELKQRGRIPSPTRLKNSLDRHSLRERAQMLLKGKVEWSTDAKLDEKWETAIPQKEKQEDTAKETKDGKKKA